MLKIKAGPKFHVSFLLFIEIQSEQNKAKTQQFLGFWLNLVPKNGNASDQQEQSELLC